jgi:DNA-binding MarR family transcriptional regulator
MVDRFEKFSLAISEISRYWHKIAAEELKPYELKSTHAIYLTTMYRYPDGITAPRLAECCGKDKADVSRMMSIMESKGLIIKELYRGTLKLTEQGTLLAAQITKRAELAVKQASEGLTDEKRAVFYEALDTITANLQRIARDGLS